MSDRNIANQPLEKVCLTSDNEVWKYDDFLKKIDQRVKEIKSGKITGSTWEEVKTKSKT